MDNEREYRVQTLRGRLLAVIAILQKNDPHTGKPNVDDALILARDAEADVRHIETSDAYARQLESVIRRAAVATKAAADALAAISAEMLRDDMWQVVTALQDMHEALRMAAAPPEPSERHTIGAPATIPPDFGKALRERDSLHRLHRLISQKIDELAARRCPMCKGPMELDQATITAFIGNSSGVTSYTVPLRCKAGCKL